MMPICMRVVIFFKMIAYLALVGYTIHDHNQTNQSPHETITSKTIIPASLVLHLGGRSYVGIEASVWLDCPVVKDDKPFIHGL